MANEATRGGAAAPGSGSRAVALLPILAVVLAALCLWRGWGRWADVQVDFGRELYVPWRMTLGEQLGTDLAWFNGPLSPHWNALLMRCFGVGFWTLVWGNLVLLAGVAWLLHGLLRHCAGPLAAGVGLCFFLVVFGFGHLVPVGNYNFVAPYSHEVTHGLLLSLAALRCMVRAGPPRMRAAGLLLGLVFLTKAEFFLATGCGLVALAWLDEGQLRERGRRLVGMLPWALVAPLSAFALLALRRSPEEALQLTLGSVANLFDARLAELDYYRRGLGLDEPGTHLREMAVACGIALLAFVPGALAARFASRAPSGHLWSALLFLLVSLLWWFVPTTWRWMARCTPALLCLVIVGGLVWRARLEGELRRRWGQFLGLAVFALVLLSKMLLQVRFGHYGFALAGPAACVLLALWVGWVPKRLRGGGAAARLAVAPVLAVYVVCAVDLWMRSDELYRAKDVTVGRGRDVMQVDRRGEFVNALMEQMERRLEPQDELLVLPEGVMINYLARRRTPTPFVNFMPPEMILFGESEMLRAFEARPPRAVVLLHKDTSEYGVPYFGHDYGQALGAWVVEHYRHLWTDPRGGPPMRPGTDFGVSLLVRRP